VICSPLAVAEHVYCAQPAGLLEIGLDGVVRRVFPLRQKGTITAVTATATRLTWLGRLAEARSPFRPLHFTAESSPKRGNGPAT
jgi:hypothetical protein